MGIFDTHAHYDDEAFEQDRDELLSALPREGIELVLNSASDIDSSRKAVALAEKYGYIYATVGIHPHEAAKAGENWRCELTALSKEPKVAAIGEIGLDYHYDFSPREVQKSFFDAQLSLAEQLGLPVVIHEREAWADTADILAAHPNVRGCMHCFSGNTETMKFALARGLYLGFGGSLTFKNAKHTPAVMAVCPRERILFETDAPYLSPVPLRGRRNDSRNIRFAAERAAELRGEDADELISAANANGRLLYNI